ncbi:hypothetical protein H5410_058818 [Solanum commersonii]|uniref:Disease resistance protein winged helix domain-containing protein n=1 Tax=Solanum commersonii TaxID=4109 RepID=A0A9J5W126_SOLCO|nr:hypothetical protein H5410_058818 [Solanum commersonii]
MAEGFIPRGEERMEDIAEGFLNELIRRSLVQMAGAFWEEVTVCRVHDLLRDLAIQKALEVNFFDIYDPKSHSISSLCTRHVIHSQGESLSSKMQNKSNVEIKEFNNGCFEINSIANDVVAILKTYNFEAGKRDDIGFASCLKKYILQCRKMPRRSNHSSNESWISLADERLMSSEHSFMVIAEEEGQRNLGILCSKFCKTLMNGTLANCSQTIKT